MPRNYFQAILAFFHFNGNSQYNLNDFDRDRLYKVKTLLEYLVCAPTCKVPNNEELMLYIPNKKIKFRDNIFRLCEASGYLWNLLVYLGKQVNMPDDEPNLVSVALQYRN